MKKAFKKETIAKPVALNNFYGNERAKRVMLVVETARFALRLTKSGMRLLKILKYHSNFAEFKIVAFDLSSFFEHIFWKRRCHLLLSIITLCKDVTYKLTDYEDCISAKTNEAVIF